MVLVPDERDLEMRRAAFARARTLSVQYGDVVPIAALRQGFMFGGERISFGSFYSGIFRPKQFSGPAALALFTTPPKGGRDAPYDDGYDETNERYVYHYRTASSDTDASGQRNRVVRLPPSGLRPQCPRDRPVWRCPHSV